MKKNRLFIIQRHLGFILGASSLAFTIINAFYIFVIYGDQTNLQTFSYLFTRIYLLLGISIVEFLTTFKDSFVIRLFQVFFFIVVGSFYILLNESGDLGGILFFTYALLLAYQYKFMESRLYLKMGIILLIIAGSEILSTLLKPGLSLSHGITSVIITLVFFYIINLLFSGEIKEYKTSAAEIKREYDSNRIFIKTGKNLVGIIHNIKSRMTSVLGFNELITDKAKEIRNPELTEYVAIQRQAIDLMTEQIQSLLFTAANCQDTEEKSVSLNRIIDGTVEIIRSFKNVRYELNITRNLTDDDTVFMSSLYLVETIENILQNALEATPKDEETRIALESRTEDGFLVLSITDSGTGIEEFSGRENLDLMEHDIFKPGKTGKENGSGIGMSSSVEMIRASGGKIFLTTGPGGTRFDLYLPREKRVLQKAD